MNNFKEEEFENSKVSASLWIKVLKQLGENKKNLLFLSIFMLLQAGVDVILPLLKKYWYVPMMILIGILFMVGWDKETEKVSASAAFSDQQYDLETQERLESMLTEIEGAGRCYVTVTLSSGSKKEYVRQEGDVLVVSDKDGNESPVVSKEKAPEIAGVTVACKGAGKTEVRNRIIRAVSTVLGIGTNKICVVESSG